MRSSLASCDIEALEMETATERICVSKDAFFRRLAVEDASVQKTILQVVQLELQQLIDDNSRLLVDYYPTIARLAREAPYETIRETMALLQSEAKKSAELDDGCHEREGCVSYFVENAVVTSIAGNEDEELSALFQDEYLRTGRVNHYVQLLAWHKSYLRLYQKSVVAIMVHDGALPLDWRSYIALMASSELRCHYLADLQQYYFVVNGGEYSWTMGIDFIPPKLFLLHEISSLLAHRPWLVTPRHIADLLSPEQEDSWSVSELVHAIVVLCQYHSMACVALGMGCADEEDLSILSHEGAEDAEAHAIRYLQRLDSADSTGSTECETEVDIADMDRDEGHLLELLKMSENRVIRAMSVEEEANKDEDEDTPDSITVDEYEFEIAESEPGEDIHADGNSRRRDTLWRFCGGSVIRYADFDVHSQEYDILNTEDFSWAEHGFPLVRRYFPGKTVRVEVEPQRCRDSLSHSVPVWCFVFRAKFLRISSTSPASSPTPTTVARRKKGSTRAHTATRSDTMSIASLVSATMTTTTDK
jgi:sestrin 1/3